MFYIHHPKCRAPLHIVEDCVFTRLRYLKLLYEDKTDDFDGKFEYLFENSIHDNVGHFTLRLIASTSLELRRFWLIRERKLLRHRLDHLLPRQVHRLFRKILRDAKTYEYVYFQSVPDLIRERKIELNNGYAIVSCSMWKIVLESLFNTMIEHEFKYLNIDMNNIIEMDPRLNLIHKKICAQLLENENFHGTITVTNIDNESKKFPLCMQHLHRVLRDRHRLSHHARFYYSLFLKESGMELDSAIRYWRNEYSKPHTCLSGCTHDWQTSEKKFIYGIRHFYGLEGGRKNYRAPKCEVIQRHIPGPRYEGGCPFKNFEPTALAHLLNDCSITDDIKDQLIKLGQNHPEKACGLFYKNVNKIDKELIIHSPVQYYSNTINLSDQR
ncbi:hypothetical protein PV327_003386 [Microctonus hyperodae]|uniref:DNA primase large subunit C-terminal domain-containing protein n=1 Tax=Microctonus hyperodae TaxID=165561 RepID=A0AA39G5I2_MICHY|nr:hypothetical protein PV327_003386 [Microctonus hyperodae]